MQNPARAALSDLAKLLYLLKFYMLIFPVANGTFRICQIFLFKCFEPGGPQVNLQQALQEEFFGAQQELQCFIDLKRGQAEWRWTNHPMH